MISKDLTSVIVRITKVVQMVRLLCTCRVGNSTIIVRITYNHRMHAGVAGREEAPALREEGSKRKQKSSRHDYCVRNCHTGRV